MNNLIEHNLFCGCQIELRPPEIFRMPGIYVISKVEVTRLRLPLWYITATTSLTRNYWFRKPKQTVRTGHVCSTERDRHDPTIFSKALTIFKETPVSMISSIWFPYLPTPIYDLGMSYTYIISHFLLKVTSFSGCLPSVVLATSATVFHPSSLLALHTLLVGLAGSRTNGGLCGKNTALMSSVSCGKRHWYYSHY